MKRAILTLSLFFCMAMLPVGNHALAFNPLGTACKGASAEEQSTSACVDAANQKSTDNPVVTTIAKTTKIISLIVGIAAVILIVVSGLTLIVSAGNAEAVKSAKSRLMAAVVGLVIAALAWTIVSFVINRLL